MQNRNKYTNIIQYIIKCALNGQDSCNIQMGYIRYSYCPNFKKFIGPVKIIPDMMEVIQEIRKVVQCKLVFNSLDGNIFVYFIDNLSETESKFDFIRDLMIPNPVYEEQ